MRERLLYIDRLKGFAIFLVVLGHIIENNVVNSTNNVIFRFIYSFHMPFFFFLSGYIANKTIKIDSLKNYLFYLRNKAVALLIPMVMWAFISKYFFSDQHYFGYKTFFGVFANAALHPNLWFLKTLFEIFVVYSLFFVTSSWLNKKNRFITDIIIISLIVLIFITVFILSKEYILITFLINFCFFIYGALLSKYTFLTRFVKNNWVGSIAALLFMVVVGHYDLQKLASKSMQGLKIIIPFFASIILYIISIQLVIPSKIDNFIRIMGRNSLVIYVTQYGFITILSRTMLIPADTSLSLLLLIAFPATVALMCLCVFLGKIASFFPFLNLLVYGVIPKKENMNNNI